MNIEIKTKNPDSRWCALDYNYNVIIEGVDATEVYESVRKITDEFIMCWVSKPGMTYIF